MTEEELAEKRRKKAEYDRKYHEANKEKRLEAGRRWRAANRDRHNEYQRSYHEAHKDKRNERVRKWHADNKDYAAARKRQRTYGVTPDQFDGMLAAQNFSCAICGTTEPGGRGFHVDHCHASSAVRGLLCTHCNSLLGFARDNKASLQRAIDYLTAAESAGRHSD